jgi:hypothetical protein
MFVQKYRRMDRSLFTGLKREERLISVEEEELAVHGATTYCE